MSDEKQKAINEEELDKFAGGRGPEEQLRGPHIERDIREHGVERDIKARTPERD